MLIFSVGVFEGGLVADPSYSLDQTQPPIVEPGVPFDVTLGSPVAIAGNESVELVTPTGISINVIPGDNVEITIDESSTNPVGALESSLVSIGIYLTIEMNDTTVEVNATIEMPYDLTMIEGMNESALEFRFYNESTSSWEAVPSTVDLQNKIVYGNTDHFSTWTVASDQIPPPIVQPGVPYDVTLGKPVAVAGNESVELVTPTGISVNVIPGESVEITIDESSTNPVGAIQSDLVSIGIYLSIEMNDTSVEVNATLGMPYDTTMIEGMNESGLEFRFYNEETSSWEAVLSWVDLENMIVYGNTSHFSTWTVTSDNAHEERVPKAIPGAPFEITLGKPVAVAGNESVELVTPTGISINVIPGKSVEITIDEFLTNPAGAFPEGLASFGLYLSIEMNATDVDISATLSLPYDSSSLSDLDEESLEFRFYNEATSSWEAVPSWVDLENKIVYGNTSHFSTWTITGSNVDTNQSIESTEDSESKLALNMFVFTITGLFALITIKKRK